MPLTHQRVTEVAPPARSPPPQLVAVPHDAEPDGNSAHPEEKHPSGINLNRDKFNENLVTRHL